MLIGLGFHGQLAQIAADDFVGIQPATGILVHFNPNGGTTLEGHGTRFTTTGTATAGTIGEASMPESPSRVGYRFLGWHRAQNGMGFDLFTGTTIVNIETWSAPPTVFAQWGHQVTFQCAAVSLSQTGNANNPAHFAPRIVPTGYSVEDANEQFTWVDLVWPDEPPVRTGFVFDGWYTVDENANRLLRFEATTEITSDVMVFAQWIPAVEHTVTFDLQGGTLGAGHSDTRQVFHNRSLFQSRQRNLVLGLLPPDGAPSVSRTNMALQGWWTAPGGPQGGGEYWTRDTVITEDTRVYAHWVYRVAFNHNAPGGRSYIDVPLGAGRTIGQDGHLVVGGVVVPMTTLPELTRSGFTFDGWWTAFTGGSRFTEDTVITGSRAVYARWIMHINPVTVTLDVNGGRWWSGAPYADRTITFPHVGATVGASDFPHFPQREGYVFLGWFLTPTGGTVEMDAPRLRTTTPIYEDVRYYANWRPAATRVEIRGGSASANDHMVARYFPVGNDVSFESFTNLFNPIVASNNSAHLHGSPYTNRWFDVDGAIYDEFTPLPGFSRFQYSALGGNVAVMICTQPDGTGTRVTRFTNIHTLEPDANGVIRLYYQWATPIEFNTNRSTFGLGADALRTRYLFHHHSFSTVRQHSALRDTADMVFELMSAMPTPNNWAALTAPAWVVIGWNTERDGSGEWFDANTVATEAIGTVYAIWTQYTHFFPGYAPAESIAPENRTRLAPPGTLLGDAEGGMPPNPVWAGHGFLGWNTAPDATGTTIGANQLITVPLRIYATWMTTVTFDATGGTMAMPGGTTVGETDVENIAGRRFYAGSMPPNPVRSGFYFVRWEDADGNIFQPGTIITQSATIYAIWEEGTPQGQLYIRSAPTNISFGTHTIGSGIMNIGVQEYSVPFVIADTRTNRAPWQVRARIDDVPEGFAFMNHTSLDSTLPEALVYYSGGNRLIISQSSNVLYSFGDSNLPDTFTITSSWDNVPGQGLNFSADNSALRVGNYTGRISWYLVDAP